MLFLREKNQYIYNGTGGGIMNIEKDIFMGLLEMKIITFIKKSL